MDCYTQYASPVGTFLLTACEEGLTGLWMTDDIPPMPRQDVHPILRKTTLWLDAYFQGRNPEMDIPTAPRGTEFQRKVWDILLTIPYGETRSYGSIAKEIATAMGKEKMSAQAVGQAVGANPVSILIPCHRVVGAKGQLTGYAGGNDKKIWLLRHESVLEK